MVPFFAQQHDPANGTHNGRGQKRERRQRNGHTLASRRHAGNIKGNRQSHHRADHRGQDRQLQRAQQRVAEKGHLENLHIARQRHIAFRVKERLKNNLQHRIRAAQDDKGDPRRAQPYPSLSFHNTPPHSPDGAKHFDAFPPESMGIIQHLLPSVKV